MWLNWTVHRGRGKRNLAELEEIPSLEQAVERVQSLVEEYREDQYWISDPAITVKSVGDYDRIVDWKKTDELGRLLKEAGVDEVTTPSPSPFRHH